MRDARLWETLWDTSHPWPPMRGTPYGMSVALEIGCGLGAWHQRSRPFIVLFTLTVIDHMSLPSTSLSSRPACPRDSPEICLHLTCLRDLPSRPAFETCLRDLPSRPAFETCLRDLPSRP